MSHALPKQSADDARQINALTDAVAKELRRHAAPRLDPAGMAWIEQRPESLWPLLDAAVAAMTAGRRDEALVTACRWLLANQLELIRYRVERGHDWAGDMLESYQEKLVSLIRTAALPQADWLELVKLLQVAKVPIRPEMAEAMALAAADTIPAPISSPNAVPQQARVALDLLARSAEDPFVVVEALAEIGVLLPPEARAYLTHEMGLSSHTVLREAVPLLLLDPEITVRQAAAAALEQVAVPPTFSPEMLRRTLLIRNWVPEAERDAIDRVVRKARVKGVACAQLAAAPALVVQASMLDGSGAQALILTTPGTRAGLFAGLLLKQSFGIRDTWCDLSRPRRDINRSLKDLQREMAWRTVERGFLDIVVQHYIGCGLKAGNLPQAAIVKIAEVTGAADWKDRGLDVAAETQTLFATFDPRGQSRAAIAASLKRSGDWLDRDQDTESWFEDDAAIRALVAQRPRPKPAELMQRMLEEILPARREKWAEKLLLTALWLRAAKAGTGALGRWQDCIVLAHELLAGRGLAELPAMITLAERSLSAARWGTF